MNLVCRYFYIAKKGEVIMFKGQHKEMNIEKNANNEIENNFQMYKDARNIALTPQRIDDYITFICGFIERQNTIIKHLKSEDKSAAYQIYDRDRAMYVLGLGEKPTPPWLQDKTI